MKRVVVLLLLFKIIFLPIPMVSAAQDKTILYVPIDNRPVNLSQVMQVAEKLDYKVLVPPSEIIGNRENYGDVSKLWSWLSKTVSMADCIVVSTDSMIYGSLVGSRKHNLKSQEILTSVNNFEKLHRKFPYIPIYAFGTVMRTPRSGSASSEEPAYYKDYGDKIFNYTALKDKSETKNLSKNEQRTLKKLEAEIPKEFLEDWFERRAKNYNANELLIDFARKGVFQYFLLGCDDSAIFSQTHLESRHLTNYGKDLGRAFFQVTSGADELGMLMVARAINRDREEFPFISIVYNEGKGGDTVPTYCNEKISDSIDAAIIATGGLRIPNHEHSDLVLAINTRANGKTFEASTNKNKLSSRRDTRTFMRTLKCLIDKKYPVGVIDISFGNGADNSLMNQLKREDLQFKLKAYGGWNTATNSSGFLIGSGSLTKFLSAKEIAELLTTRYLDDWGYQANVRQEIVGASYGLGGQGDPSDFKEKLLPLTNLLNEKMLDFAIKNLKLPRNWKIENLNVTFPWSRSFECNPNFEIR